MPHWLYHVVNYLGMFNVAVGLFVLVLSIRMGRKWKVAHASTLRAMEMATERSAQAQSRIQVYYAARYYVAGLDGRDLTTFPSDLVTLIQAVKATDDLEEQHILARKARRVAY